MVTLLRSDKWKIFFSVGLVKLTQYPRLGRHIQLALTKLTFPKIRLLATFNCKMVAIKTIQSPKKPEGEDTS